MTLTWTCNCENKLSHSAKINQILHVHNLILTWHVHSLIHKSQAGKNLKVKTANSDWICIIHIWPWPHSLCFDLYSYGTYPQSLSPAHHEGRFCPETQVVCTRYTSICPQGEGFWNLPQNSVVSIYKDISSIWLEKLKRFSFCLKYMYIMHLLCYLRSQQ